MCWLNDYEKMMFYSEENFDLICEAANLKDDKMPEILYKYRSACYENHIEALENDFLFAATPSDLNDLFKENLRGSRKTMAI